MLDSADAIEPRQVGRYSLFGEIAAGGMATVHFGLLNGPVGFRRTVAIKRLHDQFARDPEFVTQFLDEARLAARIRHPNVVQTLDVVTERRELLLVMEYVEGETLGRLLKAAARRKERLPVNVVVGIMAGALHGLHAAHEATSEHGEPLNIVHRDVSPQNILVGRDGVPRVLDFGVAKAAARFHSTRSGQIKGKLSYMSPEQVSATSMDRRTDVFAAGICLWEALSGERLFGGGDEEAAAIINKVLSKEIRRPGAFQDAIPETLDETVMRALARDPKARFQTAADFAIALEQALTIPSAHAIGRWLASEASEALAHRADVVQRIESDTVGDLTPSSQHRLSIPSEEPTRVENAADVVSRTHSNVWTAQHGRARTRRNVIVGVGVALLVLLAFVGGLSLRGWGEGEGEVAGGSSTTATAIMAPGAAPTPSVPSGGPANQPPEPSVASSAAQPSATASAPAPSAAASAPAPSTAASAPAPRTTPRRPPLPRPRPKQPNCATPTYVDDDGIRHYRMECL